MTSYFFYLDSVLLPVTPAKLTISVQNKNKTLELASGGEVNIPKSPGLTKISFEALLPSSVYSFAQYEDGFRSPNYYLEFLETVKKSGKAFDFTVIRTVTAETLLRHAAGLHSLPGSVWQEYDLNADGKVNSADARILLRNSSGMLSLNDTRMRVLMEEYSIEEDAEQNGRDFLVKINLKQYTGYAVKTAEYLIK